MQRSQSSSDEECDLGNLHCVKQRPAIISLSLQHFRDILKESCPIRQTEKVFVLQVGLGGAPAAGASV